MIKKFLYLITFLVFLPLIMWILWLVTPKTKLVAAIVDKTVLTVKGQEHISLTWILNNERYTKTSKKLYNLSRDYFGFFPLEDEKFKIKGLERFSSKQLRQLSIDADLVYFTDTYGIYNNEWYQKKNTNERSGMLYGGLSSKDVELLVLMKEQKKLIIAEFNTIGSPTDSASRAGFEKAFAVHWTGWTARHFESLDTLINKDIPQWLINNYKRSHQNKWPFKKSGIAFVNIDERIAILEDSTHLKDPMPHIVSNNFGQQSLGLPSEVKYPFWFDIISYDANINKSAADFKISANAQGLAELKKEGIPLIFPAITYHKEKDYSFYYFSGDFCDNLISVNSSYFKGISNFKWAFYDESNPMDRASFFWNFYRPLMSNIFEDYSKTLK
ncbi:hypothetical protein SAMN05421813_11845 [Daejeonella rubra]|uniref:Uncharacterized protein n=1 Tax=Daejeonella rubra TaxID=990371 RepID=A0A1G9UYR8_9SPHI|nr:hypothetical protein [Daejeonella rubra]SDM64959.1 hypothetical protein SAMN05421813_11845 [Daejeonella rubra]